MARRQVFLLILANAIISLLISVAVVWLALDRWEARQPAYAPLALPTPEPSPTRPERDILYLIQPGDSLTSIALQFGVPLADLMRANGITDPDRIASGETIIIPAGPVVDTIAPSTPTRIPFNAPTPISGRTPVIASTIAAEEPPEPQGTIDSSAPSDSPLPPADEAETDSAVQIRGVSGAGDLAREALLITNMGQAMVRMEGWTVSDGADHDYLFSDVRLGPGESIVLHTAAGEDSATDLYWGLASALWEEEATATLKNRNGEVVSLFSIE